MSSQTTLSVLAMVLSIIVAGWFSVRTTRISHQLGEERERRKQQAFGYDLQEIDLSEIGSMAPLDDGPQSRGTGSTSAEAPSNSAP